MTNFTTIKAISLGAAVAAAMTSGVASAELTGNAAITNNYIWRGVTQTTDQAAGQGGLDYSIGGFYAGTWLSNVDFSGLGDGYEMDVYAGFGGEAGGLGYDLGVITYQYPVTPNFNFTEVYASGTLSVVTVGIAYTVDAASGNDGGVFDKGDMYVNGSLDFGTKAGDISLYAGSYMYDNDGEPGVGDVDYIHYGASLGKGDFTFAVDKNDIDGGSADNVRFTVVWGKEFELL
ncbi:MAG: TorF family putative porin [Gammaproteobacteria bacterium]|jgi:uncharacterized protein (TIGR02001 family)